jgi:hypothetical protein
MSLTKDAMRDCYENVIKKCIVLLLIVSILFISFTANLHCVLADETDPYTVYGIVTDENGMAISGVLISVKNLNTQETNIDGNDTITGNPILVTTDSEGKYTFELLNLKSGYSYGDEISVTTEQDGIKETKSIIISEGGWGTRVDITLGTGESKGKEQWYSSFSPIWILFIIVLLVVLILIFAMFKRRKSEEVPLRPVEAKEELPPPSPRLKTKDQLAHSDEEESLFYDGEEESGYVNLSTIWILSIVLGCNNYNS